jgi:hypothetical protein
MKRFKVARAAFPPATGSGGSDQFALPRRALLAYLFLVNS